MAVEEAVRQIRRAARRLAESQEALASSYGEIAAPSLEELKAMAEGARPVSAEAHLMGTLCRALVGLEDLQNDLRKATSKRALQRLEKDWRRGRLPDPQEMRRLLAVVAAGRE